jgi:hypothetical protein
MAVAIFADGTVMHDVVDEEPRLLEARIVLPENTAEGWAREEGTIIGADVFHGHVVLTVHVDDRYLSDGDDGLRELGPEGVLLCDPTVTCGGGRRTP